MLLGCIALALVPFLALVIAAARPDKSITFTPSRKRDEQAKD